jgi:hypothetical protein
MMGLLGLSFSYPLTSLAMVAVPVRTCSMKPSCLRTLNWTIGSVRLSARTLSRSQVLKSSGPNRGSEPDWGISTLTRRFLEP